MVAQLIELRRRIKAIETIKKITHAMRLISMSTHTRLKSKEEPLTFYQKTINELFNNIQHIVPQWKNRYLMPEIDTNPTLIIFVGSQKGLCGNFNISLFHFFENYKKEHKFIDTRIIAIGKRAINYSKDHSIGTIVAAYNELNTHNIGMIVQDVSDHIMKVERPYSQVIIFSNILRTFFTQKPQAHHLIPFKKLENFDASSYNFDEYLWEQKAENILDILAQQCITGTLQYLLFQSLLSEHAARFISMDNSTRNAKNLLETTMLDYNKLRQAKITKELSELIGSY